MPQSGLSTIGASLRRRWRVAIVTVIIMGLTAVLWVQSLPPSYTTTTVDTVSPRGQTISAALIQQLTARYVAYASSSQVAQQVADEVGVDVELVRNNTTVTRPELTTNIYISVTMDDPDDAARVANALSERVRASSITDPLLTVDDLVPGVVATAPDPSGTTRRLAAGVLAAILIAIAAARATDLLLLTIARRRTAAEDAPAVEPLAEEPARPRVDA
jgi:capsular polysaccharide biosynthesis protein